MVKELQAYLDTLRKRDEDFAAQRRKFCHQ